MVNDAARILKTAGRRSKKTVGYQGLYLATIKSIEPFKMVIDDIDCEFLAEDVLINAQMTDFKYSGNLLGEQMSLSGQIEMNGTAVIDNYSRNLSTNNTSAQINGQVTANKITLELKNIFNAGDRVAVSSIGMNKFLVICKVVSWQ